jgi:hypothetical protein
MLRLAMDHTKESQHWPRHVCEQRCPRRRRTDLDGDMLFAQLRDKCRIAEVGRPSTEGIALRAVCRLLETPADFRSLPRAITGSQSARRVHLAAQRPGFWHQK